METEEFEAGFVDHEYGPDGDWWEAGIHHLTRDGRPSPRDKPDLWLQRIVVYGQTEQQATKLRDRILNTLNEANFLELNK